jgi:hypothetical protein
MYNKKEGREKMKTLLEEKIIRKARNIWLAQEGKDLANYKTLAQCLSEEKNKIKNAFNKWGYEAPKWTK